MVMPRFDLNRIAKETFGDDVEVKNEQRFSKFIEDSAGEFAARQQEREIESFRRAGAEASAAADVSNQAHTTIPQSYQRERYVPSDEENMAEIRRLVSSGMSEAEAVLRVIGPYQEPGGRPTLFSQEREIEKAVLANDPVAQEQQRQNLIRLGKTIATGAALAATAPGSVGGGAVGTLGFAALKYGGKRLLPKAISAIARHSPNIAASFARGEFARRQAEQATLPLPAQIAADVVWGGGLPGGRALAKAPGAVRGFFAGPTSLASRVAAKRAGSGVVPEGVSEVAPATRVAGEVVEEAPGVTQPLPRGSYAPAPTPAKVIPPGPQPLPHGSYAPKPVAPPVPEQSLGGQIQKEIPLTRQMLETPSGEVASPLELREIVPVDKLSTSILKAFRNTPVGKWFSAIDDPIATGVQAERERIKEAGESLSNGAASRLGEIYRRNFDVNDKGQILSLQGIDRSLPGAPTIQDVAARFPRFERHLSPEQREAILQIKDELASYTDIARQLDISFNTRADIMEGGFYIPRGNAMDVSLGAKGVGFDHAIRHKGVRRGKGKAGFQQEAEFKSSAEGIEEKFEYDSFGTVVKGFVQRMSEVVSDAHVAQQLKNMSDSATGLAVGQDIADVVEPAARIAVVKLRSEIAGRLGSLKKQGIRLPEQERAAKEAEKRVRDWRNASEQDLDRVVSLQLGGSTRDLIKETKRELRRLEVGERKALAALLKTEPPGPKVTTRPSVPRPVTQPATQPVERFQLPRELARSRVNYGRKAVEFESDLDRALYIATSKSGAKTPSKHRLEFEDLVREQLGLGENVSLREVAAPLRARVKELARQFDDTIDVPRLTEELGVTLPAVASRGLKAGTRFGQYEGKSLKWANASDEIETTISGFEVQISRIAKEYNNASKIAKKPGIGRDFISPTSTLGQRLQRTSFSMELADTINRQLAKEGPLIGQASGFFSGWRAVNQLLVGAGATLDNSGLGIQGLLGMARNPGRYRKAVEVNLKAWWSTERGQGDRALGKYLLAFDGKAVKQGHMTSAQWADSGLRIGGGEHEYRLGTGFAEKLGELPVVRQANRAFGVFGDTLRLEWADDMLKTELRRGRTLDEIRASGDMDMITNVVNNATGYSSKGALGSVGDFVLFAPRFLQARMNTIANGTMGLRPGANLQQREARGALLRLISYGTVVTVGANMVRGKKTDTRMFVNGRYNSNFMRIRDVGGRDFSVFGPYESMLRIVATALAGSGEGSLAWQRIESLRGLTSPTLSTLWDLSEGKNVMGRRTRDNGLDEAITIAQDVIPFSVRELPEILTDIAQGVREGSAEELGGGVAAVASEMLGGKQAPLSFTDRADALAAQLYGGAGPKPNWGDFASWWDNPNLAYKNLDAKRKERVRKLIEQWYPEFKREGPFWIEVGGEEEEEKGLELDWR